MENVRQRPRSVPAVTADVIVNTERVTSADVALIIFTAVAETRIWRKSGGIRLSRIRARPCSRPNYKQESAWPGFDH